MRTWVVGLLGVSVVAFVSSCGGGSGTCGSTPACGGNIVGTWRIVSSCGSSPTTVNGKQCAGAQPMQVTFSVSGTITFNADLTYSSNATASGMESISIPASCLAQSGATCAELDQLLSMNPAAAGSHCSASGNGCACSVLIPASTDSQTGTYATTLAGVITEMPSGGAPSVADYCVSGSMLTFSPHAGSSMDGMTAGTVTLTKQ
jgi:hypothetical protein